jgi:hypothetical protein
MERTGFPLSSLSVQGISLQFLICVLSLLGVDMLGCTVVKGAHLYMTDLGRIHLWCLIPGSSLESGMSECADLNRLIQTGPRMNWCKQWSAPFTHRANLVAGIECFFLRKLLVSVSYQFVHGV